MVPEPGLEPGQTLWVRGILSSARHAHYHTPLSTIVKNSMSYPYPARLRYADSYLSRLMLRAKQGQSNHCVGFTELTSF